MRFLAIKQSNLFIRFLIISLCLLTSAYCATDECHWSIMGPKSVTFDWRGSDDTIYYGTTSGNLTNSLAASAASPTPDTNGLYWECALTGLSADTLYYYKIGSSGTEHTFRTPSAPGSSGFTIVAASDFQESSGLYPTHTSSCMDLIASASPRFVLHCGDITGADDYGGEPRAHAVYNLIMNKWSQDAAYIPCFGNHDWDSATQVCWTTGRCAFPNVQDLAGVPYTDSSEDWCWFDYGNVRFITYPEPWSGAMADWYVKATALMNEAQTNPNIRFIITYGHRPAYDSRTGGDATLQGYFNSLGNQFSKYVLNFSGHSHHYERTYPQHGVIYVIDGAATGGMNTGDCNTLYTTCPPPAWVAFRAQRWGFVKLHITSTGITGSYIAGPFGGGTNDVNTPEGGTVDTFTIGTPSGTKTPTRFTGPLKAIQQLHSIGSERWLLY
jgi:hypothetical protein